MDSISHNKHHFMADVIASNLDSMNIMAYEHTGFYAGITSLQAYYDSSMKLLDSDVRNEVFGDRSVFTKIRDSAPTKYGNNAIVKNSMIADGCIIEGTVKNSIIFRGVRVAKGAVVENSILMQDAFVGEDAKLNCVIMDKNTVITPKKTLSGDKSYPLFVGKEIVI